VERKHNKQTTVDPWASVLLEELTVTQLLKKFPAVYGTRKFITVFKRDRHWPLFWARWIQPTLSNPIYDPFQ